VNEFIRNRLPWITVGVVAGTVGAALGNVDLGPYLLIFAGGCVATLTVERP
jgi:hypothetical protein